MNHVTLIGNLTKEPELKYTTSNDPTAVGRFTIAVNDGYGDKQKTSYINIVCFGRIAENCERYLTKGSKVAVEGKLQTGSYEKDGRKVYTTDIKADSIEFLSSNDTRLP